MRYTKTGLAIMGSLCLTIQSGFAQSTYLNGWSGEAGASLNYKTGNTESTDIGIGIKLNKEIGNWSHLVKFIYDYGKSQSIKTKDRLFLGYEPKRKINEKFYIYGDATYEKDKFQGYDYRTFLGAGIGYTLIDDGKTYWAIQGGPGWRRDSYLLNKTKDYFSIKATNYYKYTFNEFVSFTNDTSVVWTKGNTQLINDANINAKLMGNLSARFGFLVEYNTKPPYTSLIPLIRKKKTDTTTRITLVYSF